MNATNSNVEILRIRELNLDMIAPTTATYKKFEQGGSKLAIVGAPGRGKSSVIGSILYAKKHIFPVAMIVSTVEKDSPYFSKFIPNIFIHDKYGEKQLEKFIQRQKLSKEHLECPWAFVVLDDCTDDPSIFRKPL
jgi:tRNA(Met) C34 N-acetyltransferase TmcA